VTIEKAIKVLEDLAEEPTCPKKLRRAINLVTLDNSSHVQKVHFVKCYLHNMDSLESKDIKILQEAVQ